MNEIRVARMLLAGAAMLITWIAAAIALQIILDQVVAPVLFHQTGKELLGNADAVGRSGWAYLVDSVLSLLNCTLLIWLYASLRPMYGVGNRTALITSAFGVILVLSVLSAMVNDGMMPLRVGVTQAVFEAIEFPLAMLAGAAIYENQERWDRPDER